MAKGLIKTALDEICGHISFDGKTARKLEDFVLEYTTRNTENQGFFGGNLVGVYRPVFLAEDIDIICSRILSIDIFDVRKTLLAIKTTDPKSKEVVRLINPDFKVAGNEFYHFMMYVTHRFLTSSKCKADEKRRGAINALMCFQIRAITSKIHNDFTYKADEDMAMAVNMSLSKKFSIKTHGTWYKVLLNRAETVIDPKAGVHYPNLIAYENDKKVIDAITDTQGRMKDLILYQWNVIREVIENDKRVSSQKSTINVDGENLLRDLVRSKPDYLNYILNTVMSEHDFIRDDLVKLMSEMMINVKPDNLHKALKRLVTLAKDDLEGNIEEFVRRSAIYCFDIIYSEFGNSETKVRLPLILLRLKGKLMAPKGKEDELLYLRDEGDRISYQALRSTNKALIAGVRTTMLLYITARMMLKGKI